MSKNNILLSNDDGKILLSNTASLSYDDETEYVSISNISASNIVLSGGLNSILVSQDGLIDTIPASQNSGKYIISDGVSFVAADLVATSIGIASGDLSGSYPSPIFKNVSNIESGSLPISNGGLSGSGISNILSLIPSGSIIVASGISSLGYINTSSIDVSTGNWILGSNGSSGKWTAIDASTVPRDTNIQHFTCSAVGTSTSYTWTKPNSNHKWARVLIQAGGGGGGGSATAGGNTASGGGAGGFTDCVLYIKNITTANLVVGAGGTGVALNTVAATGVSSSFSGSNVFAAAYGGVGGINGNLAGTGGDGGVGFTYNGGAGGDAIGASSTAGFNSAGASGGGSGVTTSIAGKNGGIAGQYTTDTAGGIGVAGSAGGVGSYAVNVLGYSIPVGFGSGGAGGSLDNDGGNGVFGGGGGGAGKITTLPANRGGNGGDGWIIVISY